MIERKKKICLQCNTPQFLFSKGRCLPCSKLVSLSLKKQKVVEVKPSSSRGKMYDEIYLWPIYSLFIRLRDSDIKGIGRCFTCKAPKLWRDADCGHGAGRQHKSTKYNEQNNHLQCKPCNGFEGGKREVYKVEMDKRYGIGTWDLMVAASNKTCKVSKPEHDIMTNYYFQKVLELCSERNINPMTLKPMIRWSKVGFKLNIEKFCNFTKQ